VRVRAFIDTSFVISKSNMYSSMRRVTSCTVTKSKRRAAASTWKKRTAVMAWKVFDDMSIGVSGASMSKMGISEAKVKLVNSLPANDKESRDPS